MSISMTLSIFAGIWLSTFFGCEQKEVYRVVDTASQEEDFCDAVQYANFGQDLMRQYCAGCHFPESENRHGAPSAITLDSFENIVLHLPLISEEMTAQRMPPQGGIDAQILEVALQWLDCVEDMQ